MSDSTERERIARLSKQAHEVIDAHVCIGGEPTSYPCKVKCKCGANIEAIDRDALTLVFVNHQLIEALAERDRLINAVGEELGIPPDTHKGLAPCDVHVHQAQALNNSYKSVYSENTTLRNREAALKGLADKWEQATDRLDALDPKDEALREQDEVAVIVHRDCAKQLRAILQGGS